LSSKAAINLESERLALPPNHPELSGPLKDQTANCYTKENKKQEKSTCGEIMSQAVKEIIPLTED
jgi:hypothetical protein